MVQVRLVLRPGTETSEPVIRGEVGVDGLSVDVVTTVNGHPIRGFADLHAAADDCDAHSVGSATLIQYNALGVGEPRQYLPVFHARGPKLRNLLVRDDGQITAPADLKGRRVGVTSYSNTASIWLRGVLQHDFGVDPRDIVWVEGEQDFIKVQTQTIRREPPGGRKPERGLLVGMLKDGEIDALCWPGGGGYYAFYPGGPIDRFCEAQGGLRSLFEDPQEIIDHYRAAQVDHITETLAIKRSFVDREPEAPALLLELFRRAAALVREHMSTEERDRQRKEAEILGRDPFDYRFGPVEMNSIASLARFSHEQEITPRVPPLEELVPASLRQQPG